MQECVIKRIWAMPNRNTFTIPPIKELVERYVAGKENVIDPFANESLYGTIRNDLNPEFDTHFHMDALEFVKMCPAECADVVLYDPPYSFRQASECYKSVGRDKFTAEVTSKKYWADMKNEIARITKPEGIVIGFGWNTNGCGKNRGFELVELLIIPHGGSMNDTLVTVEQKQGCDLCQQQS